MDDSHAANVEADAPGEVAYFLIAPLFALCAIGFWVGGSDTVNVSMAAAGLMVVAVISVLRGWRLHRHSVAGAPAVAP